MAQRLSFNLEIVSPEGERTEIPLEQTITIGRQVGNDLVLEDQRISRQHATIRCDEGRCEIMDLGSSNGTYVEGEQIPTNVATPLDPGTEIHIGPYTLYLRATPVEVPSSEPPAERPAEERGRTVVLQAEETPAVAPSAEPEEEEDQGEVARPAEGTSEEIPEREPGRPTGPPPPPSGSPLAPAVPPEASVPPGLGMRSQRLLGYLPGIYHTDFMSRFLGIFEAILTPIEWNIDGFDLYLDPGTAPTDFLPWLANWFDLLFDASWSEAQRRQLLREAHRIYARRGTRWALSRVLEIYTGHPPRIIDTDSSLDPYTFKVVLPASAVTSDRALIERLIDAHKPAHTMYTLEFE